jgi:hypothetical protein
MRYTHFISIVALLAVASLTGCNEQQTAQNGTSGTAAKQVAQLTLPSGASIDITLNTPISSETAHVGDSWTGSTRGASMIEGRNIIPAGSTVSGAVTGVTPARKGDRAMLDIGLTSISVNGRSYPVRGSTEAVVAGSPRARNLGAIAGAAAAGALIGQATSHSTKGTVIGGLIGGGAATAVVSQTQGWQVVLKAGTPITFTTSEAVAVRI